jgi:hypothetical protein
MIKKISRLLVCFCLVCLLVLPACTQAPSRFDQAQKESRQAGNRNIAVAKDAVEGSDFNKIFPSSGNGYERIFTQEKDGFVQAVLKQNGKDVAFLTVADTLSNPSAKADFNGAGNKFKGYPIVEKGANTTAMLVGDRYQVKVISRSADFTPALRQEWLGKFDLNKLAKLN